MESAEDTILVGFQEITSVLFVFLNIKTWPHPFWQKSQQKPKRQNLNLKSIVKKTDLI